MASTEKANSNRLILYCEIHKEAWPTEDTSLTYLGNLTGLIHQVRVEMFNASEAGAWQCKEEIPVVVV